MMDSWPLLVAATLNSGTVLAFAALGLHRARVQCCRDQQRPGIHHTVAPFPVDFQRTR